MKFERKKLWYVFCPGAAFPAVSIRKPWWLLGMTLYIYRDIDDKCRIGWGKIEDKRVFLPRH